MRPGQKVTVSNPHRGTVQATVAEFRNAADLAPLRGFEARMDKLHAILTEANVTNVAILSYTQHRLTGGPRLVAFIALESAGEWRDLKGQQLTITTTTPTQQPLIETAPAEYSQRTRPHGRRPR